MLVSQTNPVRVELCLCVQRFLYVPINLHMQMLATWVKTLYNTREWLTLSTELTSATVLLRKKLTPLHFLHAGANSPRACSDFLKRRSRIVSYCLAFRLGSVTSRCSEMSPRSSPEQMAGPGYEFATVKFNLNLNFIQFVACYQLICT